MAGVVGMKTITFKRDYCGWTKGKSYELGNGVASQLLDRDIASEISIATATPLSSEIKKTKGRREATKNDG